MEADDLAVTRWADALTALLCEVVEVPAEVAIVVTESPNRALPVEFLIRVHPEDVGRVVGRKQQTLDAMRVLMNAWRGRHKRGAYLKVDGHIELAGEGARVLSMDRYGR
jgi:predicted RNA-binding protein YlqC (UPF0109 family)